MRRPVEEIIEGLEAKMLEIGEQIEGIPSDHKGENKLVQSNIEKEYWKHFDLIRDVMSFCKGFREKI